MSTGPQGMLLTKDEATAAQRTFSVHLTLSADGSNAEDLGDAAVAISKAGGAFAAMAGTITQKAAKGGWYDVVLAAADLSALGDLAYEVTGTGIDKLRGNLQVEALDLNVATVNPGAGGIAAASFAANAIDASAVAASAVNEIQSGLATAAGVSAIGSGVQTISKDLGSVDNDDGAESALNTDGDIVGTSTLNTIDVTFQVTGTFGGASAKVQTTQDPAAAVPVWTDYVDAATDNPLTADGEVIVTGGGHVAARVLTSSKSGTTDLAVTAVIRKPFGA